MEYNTLEVTVVEKLSAQANSEVVAEEAINSQVSELNELQLALVGGGMGDTVGY
ncbi:MAG: hypothetical protein WA190_10645 [Usitatibacter sp.]